MPYWYDDKQQLTGSPLTYEASSKVFTIFTEDESLEGAVAVEYGLIAEFTDYPGYSDDTNYPDASNTIAKGFIDFNDPCEEPFSFSKPNS